MSVGKKYRGSLDKALEQYVRDKLTGRASRPVRWTRTDNQLSFTEADGSPLLSAEGKTYICLISQDSRIILE